VLIRFGETPIRVDSVVTILKQRTDLANTSLRPGPFRAAIDKVAEHLIFATYSPTIEKTYPEFRQLMNEYVEGILLYQIEQQNVWGKIAVTDSALRAYFEAHRDHFMFPDRVDFSEIRAANDSIARAFVDRARAGDSFEQIAAEDSARMKRKASYPITFAPRSSTVPKDLASTLSPVAEELAKDRQMRIHIITHPDTAGGRTRNAALATQRLERLKSFLTKLGIASNRIQVYTRPVQKNVASPEERAKQNDRVDIDLIGRRAAVVGKVEKLLVPADTDDRSKKADSLNIGEISEPFRFKNGISIVKLHARDPKRHKTFEEAGSELSSAFQEYESKRLEREWLDRLRAVHPVTENKDALKSAFLPIE
jgi:peptidyl-prolyl cis-trans isomerase SurA